MNRIKNSLAILLSAIVMVACTAKDERFATVTGHYKGKTEGKELHLCKVEHGAKTKVATTTVGGEGNFAFTCAVEEPGLYVVNVIWSEHQKADRRDHDLKRFYLENGVEIDIELNDGNYTLLSTNSDKNKLLTQWNNQIDTVFSYSHGFMYSRSDYTDYFPLLPGFVQGMENFKSKVNSGDKDYDELLKLMAETDMASSALRLLYTPRPVHPKREDYPDYYDVILSEQKPVSERLLDLPNGMDYVRSYASYAVMSQPETPAKDQFLSATIAAIPGNILKGYYAIDNLNRFRAYDDSYLEYYEMVEPYLNTAYLQEKLKAFELSIRKFEKGATAFDFDGKDINGKVHKLSDYKGSLVYVDVWATWCGPCKTQIPALKELEKKFHGQPITFLSLSVDKPKDQQKWIDFVKAEDLKGVQLMADKAFDSDVAKAYGINAIPRFMLFDKEGKVVTIDASRPSEEKTEKLLWKLLN